MIRTKLIYDVVSGPAQLETLINNTLETLQQDGKYRILDVKLYNSQALVVYDEIEDKKSKKVLNEKA